MFCQNCGHQNKAGDAFCANCGNALQTVNMQQPQGMYMPPQGQYPPMQNQQKPKKSRKGLAIGLSAAGVVLVAAAVVLVILLMGGTSVVGVWYSDTLGEAMEFRDNGRVYTYSAYDDIKSKYEYNKRTGNGIITTDDEEYAFTVEKERIKIEDKGTYKRADEDFDIDEFIDDIIAALPPVETPQPTPVETPQPTPVETPQPTPETVTDQTMTIAFVYGERTGVYTGEILNGLPDGYGRFATVNLDGVGWVYEGQWAAGHLSGQGTTVWEDGFSNGGWYENDLLNGEGWEIWYGVVQYEGGYLDGEYNGQGTYYNYHGEILYSGAFNNGFIAESAQDRLNRVGAFKDQSVPSTVAELYSACEYEVSVRAQVTGEIFDIYVYPETNPSYCEYLIYVDGVWDTGSIIKVFYTLSEGEPVLAEGQIVTVWGTTEYLYSYTTVDGEYLTVPLIEAWSVE